jgi:hypothetical protein
VVGRESVGRRTLKGGYATESINCDSTRKIHFTKLPAVTMNTSETALLLGLQEHDIAPVVAAKLFVPLGKPAANAPKYFAAVEVAERAANPEWLSQATKALARYWQRKNQRRLLARMPGSLQAG